MKGTIKSLGMLLFLCVSLNAQHIDSVNPQSPAQGGTFEIIGTGFGDRQGRWVVEASRVVNSQTLLSHLPVLRWKSDRILVEVPEDMAGDTYGITVRIPNQMKGSNAVRLNIRQRPPNKEPQSSAPWIRRSHVTSRAEIWIYGLNFEQLRGGWPPDIPAGGRVRFTGNGRDEDLRVTRWLNDIVKVRLPARCEPGAYEVVVSRGSRQPEESNSFSFVLRPEMVGEAHPGTIRGDMHIDAVEPARIAPGTAFTVLGDHFDGYRQGQPDAPIRVGQGERVVELVDTYKGQARAHACLVKRADPAEYPDLVQGTLLWFNDHIVAVAPSDLEAGRFLLRIRDRSNNRSSNTIAVRVEKGPGE